MAPATVFAVRFKVEPAHNGPLFAAVGADGVAFTVTAVVEAALVQPLTVTVSEYVPAIATVAFVLVGSSSEEVKPPGPVHE